MAGRTIPLFLPSIRDPRLHVAAVISSLQVLGQTFLDFDLSIAQILISILTCAAIEVTLTAVQRRALAWPASAMLTGNGVAFILRVPGTEHGDWWSLNGATTFAAVAAFSLLSKYAIRRKGQQVYNPSNIGLVLGFLILGPLRADPQDLWWGPMSPALLSAFAIIVVGGMFIIGRMKMLTIAGAFFVTFCSGVALLAIAGHGMVARWHVGPVTGLDYWVVLALSPEVLVFMFFMITDPRTVLNGRVGMLLYGGAVGLVAVVFVSLQRTEYATKVAILASLAVVCTVRPALTARLPLPGSSEDNPFQWWQRMVRSTSTLSVAVRSTLVLAGTCGIIIALQGTAPIPDMPAGTAIRPSLLPAAAPIPPVSTTKSDSVPGLDTSDDAVRAMASDLIEDLMIEQEAIRQSDPDLAATATTGRRLDDLRESIAAGTIKGSEHDITSLQLLVVRDPANPQAQPRPALRATGTTTHPSGTGTTPLLTTFTLEYRGGHYLISDAEPGPEG